MTRRCLSRPSSIRLLLQTIPNMLAVKTLSKDRDNYILHPPTGEKLSPESIEALKKLRDSWGANLPKGQIVISDGLNAKAIMDEGHLAPYLEEIRKLLGEYGDATLSDKNIVVTSGRVRAGYESANCSLKKPTPTVIGGSYTLLASGLEPCITPIRSISLF